MVDVNVKVPAIEKLLDYAASGIGAVAGPMLATWRARQDAKAKLIGAQADADSLRLIAEAQANARRSLLAPDETGGGVLEIGTDGITQRIEFQEKKRQANIVSVVQEAAAELGDKQVPDHEPDPDWTARFFDCVQDVSSKDMRELWTKILSGEVEEPGRTSLRTLDILKNMTQKDAKIFEDVCDFVIGDFIYNPKELQENISALKYGNILHIRSIGLCYDTSTYRVFDFDHDNRFFLRIYQNNVLKISARSDIHKLRIPAVILTTSGDDLCRIIERTFHMDYLCSFSRFLRRNNCELSYARIVKKLPDGSMAYSPSFIPIEPEPEQLGGAAP